MTVPNPPAPQRHQMCPACPNPWPCSVHAYPVAPAPQRPEPEADGLSELAEFWKGEYIKAVDILDRATNALTDSIMASGNDARTNMHWVNKMRRGLEELRGSAPPPVAAQPDQAREIQNALNLLADLEGA